MHNLPHSTVVRIKGIHMDINVCYVLCLRLEKIHTYVQTTHMFRTHTRAHTLLDESGRQETSCKH